MEQNCTTAKVNEYEYRLQYAEWAICVHISTSMSMSMSMSKNMSTPIQINECHMRVECVIDLNNSWPIFKNPYTYLLMYSTSYLDI